MADVDVRIVEALRSMSPPADHQGVLERVDTRRVVVGRKRVARYGALVSLSAAAAVLVALSLLRPTVTVLRPDQGGPVNGPILYTALGEGIVSIRPDGTDRRLVVPVGQQVMDLALSPDGLRLAYVAAGDVWLVGMDGGDPRNVTSTIDHESGLAWSPDSSRLAFERRISGRPMGTPGPTTFDEQGKGKLDMETEPSRTDVMLVDLRREPLQPRVAWDGASEVSFSPDGRRIAYTDHNVGGFIGVVTAHLAHSRDRRIGDWGSDSPHWSPDGSEIAFIGRGSSTMRGRVRSDADALYTVSPDGSGRRRLLDDLQQGSVAGWSPDGSAVVVTDIGRDEVHVVSRTGRRMARLVDTQVVAWAPDSSSMAVRQRGQLWIMKPDGSEKRPAIGMERHVDDVVWVNHGGQGRATSPVASRRLLAAAVAILVVLVATVVFRRPRSRYGVWAPLSGIGITVAAIQCGHALVTGRWAYDVPPVGWDTMWTTIVATQVGVFVLVRVVRALVSRTGTRRSVG